MVFISNNTSVPIIKLKKILFVLNFIEFLWFYITFILVFYLSFNARATIMTAVGHCLLTTLYVICCLVCEFYDNVCLICFKISCY